MTTLALTPSAASPRATLACPQPPPLQRYVALRGKRMHDLGHVPRPALRDDLDTRLILLGPRWSLARLHALGLLQATHESGCDAANGLMRRRA